jgi:hypothetical protein
VRWALGVDLVILPRLMGIHQFLHPPGPGGPGMTKMSSVLSKSTHLISDGEAKDTVKQNFQQNLRVNRNAYIRISLR